MAGPLRLMFQDEARFGRIADTRSCGAAASAATRQSHGDAAIHLRPMARVSPQDGCFDNRCCPHVNTECMQIFLDEIACHPDDNVVMVLNGASWHKSQDFHLPGNLRLLFLPPYSPKLNPQGASPGQTARSPSTTGSSTASTPLEDHLVAALLNLENAPARVKGITAWDWIINTMSIANWNKDGGQLRLAHNSGAGRHHRGTEVILLSRGRCRKIRRVGEDQDEMPAERASVRPEADRIGPAIGRFVKANALELQVIAVGVAVDGVQAVKSDSGQVLRSRHAVKGGLSCDRAARSGIRRWRNRQNRPGKRDPKSRPDVPS